MMDWSGRKGKRRRQTKGPEALGLHATEANYSLPNPPPAPPPPAAPTLWALGGRVGGDLWDPVTQLRDTI
jgi:hypothetical protein